jgi:hypothetical protein
MYLYGRKLFGFESNGFAAMGKFFIPCNIIMLAFVAVDHVVRSYFKVDLPWSIH